MSASEWAWRAGLAESAVHERNLRRLWLIPGTSLGVVAAPATRHERMFLVWHYWWQAHLLDVTVDAEVRAPSEVRRRRIADIARGIRRRNFGRWSNSYYDDMAWLAIALERAQRLVGIDFGVPLATLTDPLYDAWAPERGGGIPWRIHSDFFNTPANGPAGIVLARVNRLDRAVAMADWLDATLRDPDTGLIFDGIHQPGDRLEENMYTYCQGVALGLETELALRTPDSVHAERVHRLVDAVAHRLTSSDVIVGAGGGDGGLFAGILARYLAMVAVQLPGDSSVDGRARASAAAIVLASAAAAWDNRIEIEGRPVFGPDWSVQARGPGTGAPERDLSVQLAGWLLLEAAHRVAAAPGPEGEL
ncbi:fructose-bisphosphate aldolase [Aldersonia sp. NBC_00410]|uniref:glycoside hydrolase family 76 protein n=1 Tax=Aldersonia sp. NBC_00410 TaxID=2975954 RepID=UPI00225C3B65|nr:glycoside hydrolase family 76 protein [Aldersonia sp. NBC_00410]MCX5042001.1 fructose-bisphosphate aldolase [Aldersonia sp. NBC_00410]